METCTLDTLSPTDGHHLLPRTLSQPATSGCGFLTTPSARPACRRSCPLAPTCCSMSEFCPGCSSRGESTGQRSDRPAQSQGPRRGPHCPKQRHATCTRASQPSRALGLCILRAGATGSQPVPQRCQGELEDVLLCPELLP